MAGTSGELVREAHEEPEVAVTTGCGKFSDSGSDAVTDGVASGCEQKTSEFNFREVKLEILPVERDPLVFTKFQQGPNVGHMLLLVLIKVTMSSTALLMPGHQRRLRPSACCSAR